MKSLYLLGCLLVCLNSIAQVRVNGYYRSNGTYVQPHYRSSPDGNPYNNYSYPGNENPYTGKVAPGNPSTYLDNYYNRNSGSSSPSIYTNPSSSNYSIDLPSTSSYRSPTYSSNYNSSTYNSVETTGSTYLYVRSSQLNIRIMPSTISSVLCRLDAGASVKVLDRSYSPWYLIKAEVYDPISINYKSIYGYAHSAYLAPSLDSKEITATTEPTSSNYNSRPSLEHYRYDEFKNGYHVSSTELNVREGPSTQYPMLFKLSYGERVYVVSDIDYPWLKIKIGHPDDRKFGYVHSSYVSDFTLQSFKAELSNSKATPLPINNHPYGAGNGNLSLWTDCSDDGFLYIYIDGDYAGVIKKLFFIGTRL